MWALCLVTLASQENISDLSIELANELQYFKEEIENNDPIGGKVQLNPIPDLIKNMIKKDSSVLERLKTESSHLEVD